jgi:chromosome segregation ATPase
MPFIEPYFNEVGSEVIRLADELTDYLSNVHYTLKSYRRRFQTRLEELLQIQDQIEEEILELEEAGLQPDKRLEHLREERNALETAIQRMLGGLDFIMNAINEPL